MDNSGEGGDGGVGRIRIEYCESLSGSTNPPASVQKLNCYIAEQVESAPYDRTRLNLPESFTGGRTYQVQYGRRLLFGGAGEQVATLRVPAAAFTGATLDALVSEVGAGSLTFRLDIGDDGSWDWEWSGNVNGAAALNSPGLHAAFSRYWAAHGAPLSGTLDVPVKVSLSKAGQVLLTNLQVTPTGSKMRYLRLPAGQYSTATVSLLVNHGGPNPGPLTVAADVGNDGTVDWTWSGSPTYPARLTTANLAAAFNAYLQGQSGDVDVPIRFYIAPFLPLGLDAFSAARSARPDVILTAGDIAFGAASPTEGDEVNVAATLRNTGDLDSGPVTAAFYATATGWGEWYIGSAFVPDVPAGGSAQASIPWNTLGFTGPVTVTAAIDPYNRLAELDEENNQASAQITVLTRPDLEVTGIALSDDEPLAGETVTVTLTLANHGQTAAATSRLGLYDGHPDQGGASICQLNQNVPATASRSRTCLWTPAGPGPYRLFARADRLAAIDEADESNNLSWQDIHVGLALPVELDSGNAAADPAYDAATGYGVVDNGSPDVLGNCGPAPHESWRRDDDGQVSYRFDHLQPGHFYHLDLALYDCSAGTGRVQYVTVDGHQFAGPIDLGDGKTHKLSLLLDPALYADRSVSVAVEERSGNGAIVSEIALHDVDYRYADSGGANDPAYAAKASPVPAYGWLDGSATNVWGSLPYQSARRDLNDDDVRYRFDGLDPAKNYVVHLSFYQGSGGNRVQQFWIDEQQLGQDLTIASGQRYSATLTVPTAAYLADGSIIVTIKRSNASEGAMVNEIALEELTQAAPVTCQVTETPRWTTAFGNVTIAGQPAPAGSLVSAENLAGQVVGCFVVNTAGQYGYMNVYGAFGSDPGMADGEIVTFRVNGSLAVASPVLAWQDDKTPHPINLAAGATQSQAILLNPGWNLISSYVEPPVATLSAALSAISGRYCRVLGERGIFDCNVPAPYQSLSELHAGQGYYLRLEGDASANLLLEGVPLDPATPIDLHGGWNWVGYLPRTSQPVAEALQSIAGQYLWVTDGSLLYDPAYPGFSTLTEMTPGDGYLIYMSQAATLTYPAGSKASTPAATGQLCPSMGSTPSFSFLFGDLLLDGLPARAGTRIEVLTPRNEVAGCFVTGQEGQYGFLPVYGEDGSEPAGAGFREGEALRLRVDGIIVEPAGLPAWSGDRQPHRLDLSVAAPRRLYLPMLLR